MAVATPQKKDRVDVAIPGAWKKSEKGGWAQGLAGREKDSGLSPVEPASFLQEKSRF